MAGVSRQSALMLDTLVSDLNTAVGRVISGVLLLSLDQPVALCLVLAGLAGASGAVLLDAVARWP